MPTYTAAATQTVNGAVTTAGTLLLGLNPVNANTAPLTMVLPTPTGSGEFVTVTKTDASTNAVTISGTINGTASSTTTLVGQTGTVTLMSDGSGGWWTISDRRTLAFLDARYAAFGSGASVDANGHLAESIMPTSARSQALVRRTGASAATMERSRPSANLSLVSGQMQVTAIPLVKGQVITTITFVTGTTAAGTPTNQWFALYDPSRALVGITADDTTTGWATNSEKTLTLSTPYTVANDGVYYVALMIAATTTPTIAGYAGLTSILGTAPVLSGRDTTNVGLTTPATAPATTTLAASTTQLYAHVA